MALSYPLATALMMDILPIEKFTLDLPETVEMSRTAGGAILTADIGDRLWQGTVELGPMQRNETQPVMARINLLRPGGRSFLAFDPSRPRPLLDPTGALLGAAVPVLHTIATDGREIRIGGLPAGYGLSPGDRLSWTYGTNPTRYAFHEIAIGGTADGAGVTGLMEVSPVVPEGAVTGATVRLVRPLLKARIVPASVQPGRRRALLTEGVSFQFQQMVGV